jgi:hypothetical protein
MYNMQITILVLATALIPCILCYLIFPRQTKNVLMRIIPSKKKRYVVCYVRYTSGMQDRFNVVPNLDGLTKVGEYSYQLSDNYVLFSEANRKHFLLFENDVIPKNFLPQTEASILFQAAEIQTALNNTVMEYLFSKKKELLILGLFALAAISLLAIIYNIYELRQISAMLQPAVNVTVNVP